jgi:hypothetical protein
VAPGGVLADAELEFGAALSLKACDELMEWGLRLRHDVGKYITMQQRWLGDEASVNARCEALLADVLQTRRREAETEDLFALWAEFEAVFGGRVCLGDGTRLDIVDDVDLMNIKSNVCLLEDVVRQLSSERPNPDLLERAEGATREISGACRSFSRRLRRALSCGAHDV